MRPWHWRPSSRITSYNVCYTKLLRFPEIDFDKVDEVLGMDIIICTTTQVDAEAKALLKAFNMPFNS